MKKLISAAAAALVLAAAVPAEAKPESFSPTSSRPTVFKPSSDQVDYNSFHTHLGDKDGPNCTVKLTDAGIDVCGTLVPIDATTQYRHTNRTPLGLCNAFGWCIKIQHRFALSWRAEGERRQQVAVFLRNNKRAEQFNEALAEWLDVMPADMCERPNPIPGCR